VDKVEHLLLLVLLVDQAVAVAEDIRLQDQDQVDLVILPLLLPLKVIMVDKVVEELLTLKLEEEEVLVVQVVIILDPLLDQVELVLI
jgi:hypothetical protein